MDTSLCIQQLEKIGTYGYDGYREEYFGCGTLAVPVEKKDEVEEVDDSIRYNMCKYPHDDCPKH